MRLHEIQAIFSLIARAVVALVLVAEGLRQINIWPDIAALFSHARLAYPFGLGVAMVGGRSAGVHVVHPRIPAPDGLCADPVKNETAG